MRRVFVWGCFWLALGGLCLPTCADVVAASIFGDNMVLQRGMPVPVWGTAAPGEAVTVRFGSQRKNTVADAQGKWRINLAAMKANAKPQSLVITGKNTLTFTNVLIGEVWVGSGQSNMEMLVAGVNNSVQEAEDAAHYPQIRFFTVDRNASPIPLNTCGGSWLVCNTEQVAGFSATGYFFARTLTQKLGVPVGFISSAWGGTRIQPWTPVEGYMMAPSYRQQAEGQLKEIERLMPNQPAYDLMHAAAVTKYQTDRKAWYQQIDAQDPGITQHWADPAFTPQGWKTIAAPAAEGEWVGSLWNRKTVDIPASWVGKPLMLHLGAVDEVDDTYVNGVHVGRTWFEAPGFWTVNRLYQVPATAVTSTKVTVAVRVFNLIGGLGLSGPAEEMYLTPAVRNGEKPVSLAGDWQYNEGLAVKQSDAPTLNNGTIPGANGDAGGHLYNGMIHPLIPFAIRGIVWYQGEQNAGQPDDYGELLPALIASWRNAWGEGDMPFGIIQLANYQERQTKPVESPDSWANLRDAQLATALAVKNTTLSLTIDLGDGSDVHPRNKQDLGYRLALAMLAKVYGRKLVYSGPIYKSMAIEGAKIRLQFDFAAGLKAKGDHLTGFAIAGDDKVFHFAQAVIEGNTIVVSSNAVPKPVAVRYGWGNNPPCNLYNAAGLPASPFRTDNWKRTEVTAANEPMGW